MDVRRRIRVSGTVQGVGFRPFVYRHAVSLGLVGTVRNDLSGLVIDVAGDAERVAELCRRLVEEPPPLARVERLDADDLGVATGPVDGRFVIVGSESSGRPAVAVGIDSAVCDDCLGEMADPGSRRHRHPFVNCTNCGPRYTIVRAAPYDRANTTMAGFVLCGACQAEFDDPRDRRFHAQPNACPDCGPVLTWRSPAGTADAEGGDALDAAAACLRRGQIAAVKGLGGYHLAVDATDEEAVAVLRRRKARDDKPFAVMVRDATAAAALVDLDPGGTAALASPRRPVVLAPRRAGARVADAIAPGLPDLGVLLAYTPLHHLLLEAVGRPLVMTSGNLSDEPIAHVDDDAVARLGPLVDGLLTHDRPIHVRCDDSVVRAGPGWTQVLRRSRGYAPEPLGLTTPARRHVLAVGAELKSTVSVARDGHLVTSHHIGDLEHPAAHAAFEQAVEHLCRLCSVTPELVAHDLHPEYLSTKWALDTDLPTLGVQHHHAHIASCLVEHRHDGRVLGIAFDGLGYGCDRTLWGGEFVAADLVRCDRLGHLRAVALPGGAAAIREPWRMAVAWVHAVDGPEAARREGRHLDPRAAALVEVLDSGQAPLTTSVGRLFDAVAALLAVRSRVTYEGQAAIELEALARRVPRSAAPVLAPDLVLEGDLAQLDPGSAIAAVLDARERGTPTEVIAAGFHEGLGRATAELATRLAARHGLGTVALSGGVFQNARLSEVVASGLHEGGLTVLAHRRVPPNDGGISVGQAGIAARLEKAPA